MKLNPNDFARFLGACADRGDGYIMGAVGENPREMHEWYFNQYRENEEQYAQALEWKEGAQRVWDCQGLADGYLTEKLGVKINVRARNNYASWCGIRGEGRIPAERRVPGAAVFMDDGSYIHHVGFLEKPVKAGAPAGDWWVVEARGVMHGVVRTKFNSRGWNRWGWMTAYFEYDAAAGEEQAREYGARMLRYGSVGEDVAALQRDLISLNYSCGRWGADGEFGRATESAVRAFQLGGGLAEDGIAGPDTFSLLDRLLKETGEEREQEVGGKRIEITEGRTWNVRAQPDAGGAVMGIARCGEAYAPSGQSTEGWLGIVYNGERAWVSRKAVAA